LDDAGHVGGLDLNFTQRARLERKIHQLARNRIKPTPSAQVGFEEVRGMTFAASSNDTPCLRRLTASWSRQGSGASAKR
jgi:hypothetical protein